MQRAIVAFNRRAVEEGSHLHVSLDNGHLESCVIWDDPCVCSDLLLDPGRIFDKPASSNVPAKQVPQYFTSLARRHGTCLTMRYDGHVINCKNGIHFKDRYKIPIECACQRIVEHPERYFRIPEHEWSCKKPVDKRHWKQEWMRFNETEHVREMKFNVLCQYLGQQTYRYVKTAMNDYHLNTCPFSHANEGPDTCGCHVPIAFPARYFVEKDDNGMYKVRGEEGHHRKDCSRVQTLLSETLYGNEFPENIECDCK